jgi:hypothetical protein
MLLQWTVVAPPLSNAVAVRSPRLYDPENMERHEQ